MSFRFVARLQVFYANASFWNESAGTKSAVAVMTTHTHAAVEHARRLYCPSSCVMFTMTPVEQLVNNLVLHRLVFDILWHKLHLLFHTTTMFNVLQNSLRSIAHQPCTVTG